MITEQQIDYIAFEMRRRYNRTSYATPCEQERYFNLLKLRFAKDFISSSAESDVILELIRCKREIEEITEYFRKEGFKI